MQFSSIYPYISDFTEPTLTPKNPAQTIYFNQPRYTTEPLTQKYLPTVKKMENPRLCVQQKMDHHILQETECKRKYSAFSKIQTLTLTGREHNTEE